MMKKEQRICGDASGVRAHPSEGEPRQNKPLEVHFGPLTQVGPALSGHKPNKSLPTEVSSDHQRRTEKVEVAHPPTI